MSDEQGTWEAMGVANALAKSYAQDIRGFLPLLAAVLESSMPDETVVERKGGLFQKIKPVHKVSVKLEDLTFTLEDIGRGPLSAHRIKTVRGITLKTEPLAVDDWLADLSHRISIRADHNEKTFFAIKELLGG